MLIDWVSITLELGEAQETYRLHEITELALERTFGTSLRDAIFRDAIPTSPRQPYLMAWRQPDNHIVTFANTVGQGLIEVTGQGCQVLRDKSLMGELLEYAKSACTRLDIAIDLPHVTPDEIVAEGYSAKFKAHTRIASKKGTTHYVGSVKSERYCRVYRYNDPHPRSKLTRIELVHRKAYAKIAVQAILTNGLSNATQSALASYKFKHPAACVNADALATVAVVKSSQKTITWLIAQCAPAFKRLVADGTIPNPHEFLQMYFDVTPLAYRGVELTPTPEEKKEA